MVVPTESSPEPGRGVHVEISQHSTPRFASGEDGGPAGRLPMTLPVSAQAIADSPRDVPGKFLGDEYALPGPTEICTATDSASPCSRTVGKKRSRAADSGRPTPAVPAGDEPTERRRRYYWLTSTFSGLSGDRLAVRSASSRRTTHTMPAIHSAASAPRIA